jgi:hypothetical protein
MRLDIKKWNEARKELEVRIKAMKHNIRRVDKPIVEFRRQEDGRYKAIPTGATYRGGDDAEFYSLGVMKCEATVLYALRAACRGKQHCAELTVEDAKARILPQYALSEEPVDLIVPEQV